jgi:hypothetical protein
MAVTIVKTCDKCGGPSKPGSPVRPQYGSRGWQIGNKHTACK